jgi:hypothetical protein
MSHRLHRNAPDPLVFVRAISQRMFRKMKIHSETAIEE